MNKLIVVYSKIAERSNDARLYFSKPNFKKDSWVL